MEQQEKIKTGTTTVGMLCKDCVILASDSKTTLGYMTYSKTTDKIVQIDDKIAVTTAGSSGDIQAVIRMLRAEIKLYKLMRNAEITVNAVSTLLANILQGSRYYPYISVFLVGGADKKGFHLISNDVVGALEEKDNYVATGSGSPFVYGVMENEYREGLTREEGIDLAIRAVRAAIERDVFSGGTRLKVAVIDQKGVEFLSDAKIAEIAKR